MRRVSRDTNHSDIVIALQSLGAYVFDAAAVGSGFPDIVVFFRGKVLLIEIKDGARAPSARKLRDSQVFMHAEAARCGVKVHVVTNVDEALALLGAKVSA